MKTRLQIAAEVLHDVPSGQLLELGREPTCYLHRFFDWSTTEEELQRRAQQVSHILKKALPTRMLTHDTAAVK